MLRTYTFNARARIHAKKHIVYLIFMNKICENKNNKESNNKRKQNFKKNRGEIQQKKTKI